MGHPSPRIKNLILCRFHLPLTIAITRLPCLACAHAKAHVLLHPSSPSLSTFPFQLLFLDVQGPIPILSTNRSRFYFSTVDDYSKFTWLLFMQSMSNVSSIMIVCLYFVSNTLTTNVISVQSN